MLIKAVFNMSTAMLQLAVVSGTVVLPDQRRRSHMEGHVPLLRVGGARRGTGLEQLQMPIGKILALSMVVTSLLS